MLQTLKFSCGAPMEVHHLITDSRVPKGCREEEAPDRSGEDQEVRGNHDFGEGATVGFSGIF